MSRNPDFKVNIYRPSDLSTRTAFKPAPWSVVSIFYNGVSMRQPGDMPDTIWEACIDTAKWFRSVPSADGAILNAHLHGIVLVRADARTGEPIINPNEVGC